MVEERLINAFDDCVTEITNGASVEECLQRYPDLQAELRPMLEVGLLVQRARYEVGAVEAARMRVKDRLSDLLGPAPLSYGVITGLIVLALLLGGIVGGVSTWWVITRSPGTVSPPASPTVDAVVVTVATSTAVPVTPTLRPLPSLTAIPPTQTVVPVSPTATQAATVAPLSTLAVTAAPTSSTTNPIVVIEGPIQQIEGNMITIFNQIIIVGPGNPILVLLQIDDVVRVEAVVEGTTIKAVNIILVSVEAFISESGQTWRDSGTCENPPPQWVLDAGGGTDWLSRCRSSGAPSASGGGGGGGDDDDDGDDDD